MNLGLSEIDITPSPGIDLAGYAARVQPSTSVLDPLHLRALYLEDGPEKLLWLHADLIALDRPFVSDFRSWAQERLGFPAEHVLLTATHTHAAPATVDLTGCGRRDAAFLRSLRAQAETAAREALENVQPVHLAVATANCPLAIDRRNKPSAHTDPVVTALGFKRPDGTFAAVVLNYAMHPTALGHTNRAISADWPGYAGAFAAQSLPGHPVALVTNGACGNINPPKQNISQPELRTFGETVARAVLPQLLSASADPRPILRVRRDLVPMPLDTKTPEEIDKIVDHNLTQNVGQDWAKPWVDANEHWRKSQKALVQSGGGLTHEIELFAVGLGPIHVLAVNGEVFSRFTTDLRAQTDKPLFTVTYANCAYGYIPTQTAYTEGGYEVDQAHYFYNTFRPKPGSLELLTDRAADLIRELDRA
jgi:neutral ceramidase